MEDAKREACNCRIQGCVAGAHRKIATQCKGMERYYMNVMTYDKFGEPDRAQPAIWSVGKLMFADIKKTMSFRISMEDDEPLNLLDLEKGHNLQVNVKLKGGGFPQYTLIPRRRETHAALGDNAKVERWMANIWDLNIVSLGWQKAPSEFSSSIERLNKVLEENLALVSGKKSYADIATCDEPKKIIARNCAFCSKEMQSVDATYCSEKCLRDYVKARKQIKCSSCPHCGTEETIRQNTIERYLTFKCGYHAMGNHVSQKCNTRPTCKCSRAETDAGCSCGTHSTIVDAASYKPKI